ncbi:MAG: hypothetical protein IT452_09750 [Planctomycetia bacterium]|nr:hypothetical protein [Planctomycetia bacterium]
MTDLDQIVVSSLRSFLMEVVSNGWQGREREAVSLYAFGALLAATKPMVVDPRQIGVEVAVPQIPARGDAAKLYVCKDLVIWPRPFDSAWSNAAPLAVMEWKVDAEVKARRVSAPEFLETERWLEEFTLLPKHEQTSGYAVHVSFFPPARVVSLLAFRCGRRFELTPHLS